MWVLFGGTYVDVVYRRPDLGASLFGVSNHINLLARNSDGENLAGTDGLADSSENLWERLDLRGLR